MTDNQISISPAQELSKKIVQRLIEEGLLKGDPSSKLESKIAEGKMTSSDWKLVFEKSLGLHKGTQKE